MICDCSHPSPRLPLQEETSGQERQTKEMGRISSSHCSPVLLLCLNTGSLGGLFLGPQYHFHIHFMGKNIVITYLF